MDEKALREALKQLRHSKPELRKYSKFRDVSGIHRPTVENTEGGHSTPGIDIIEKWVQACGLTLSQFFARLEGKDAPDSGPTIVLGYEKYYRLLTDIFESDQDFYKDGIRANLEAMAMIVSTVEIPSESDRADKQRSPPKHSIHRKARRELSR